LQRLVDGLDGLLQFPRLTGEALLFATEEMMVQQPAPLRGHAQDVHGAIAGHARAVKSRTSTKSGISAT
jgi:hypothetical protein